MTDYQFFHLGDLRIRYRIARRPAARQLILLHGWGGSIESMNIVFEELAPSFSVLAIDFPGHGESSLPPRAWSVSDFASCLLAVMDHLEFSKPDVIAHSF